MPETHRIRIRDRDAALRFLRKALKGHRGPEAITIDGLRSYGAAMDKLGCRGKQETTPWPNKRV